VLRTVASSIVRAKAQLKGAIAKEKTVKRKIAVYEKVLI
jgi:hypothetical protein